MKFSRIALILTILLIGAALIQFWGPKSLRPLNLASSPTSKHPPIILVHGFNQSSAFWNNIGLHTALAKHHYVQIAEFRSDQNGKIALASSEKITSAEQSAYYLLSLPNAGRSDIRDSAVLLEKAIQQVCQDQRCEKVQLIAFSAGGIVCRQYLTQHLNDHHVLSLTTISSPHLGSEFAWLAEGYNTLKNLIDSYGSNMSGNLLDIGSRKLAVAATNRVLAEFEKFAAKTGLDITSPCARMLTKPEAGNFLDQLSKAPHPSDVAYHCVITQENLMNYQFDSLKADFQKLKEGNFSHTDIVPSLTDLARHCLRDFNRIGEYFSKLQYRGDGVVSQLSQDLNEIDSFKNSATLKADLYKVKTHHGGMEIRDAIMQTIPSE